jgi:hypothetical protein
MAFVALSALLLPLGGVSYLAWGKNAPPRGRSRQDADACTAGPAGGVLQLKTASVIGLDSPFSLRRS